MTNKNENEVILSEEDYNNLMETQYISSIPGLKEDIKDCVDEKEVEW